MNPDSEDLAPIEAEAAVWLSLRDRGLSEAETAEFMRWLQQSPHHAELFADLDRVWRRFNRAGELRPVATATLAGPAATVDAPRPMFSPCPAARPRRRAPLVWTSLAAAAVLAVAWVGWTRHAARPTAETPVGAFQKLDLPDGSVVQLNTDSAIRVRYSAAERRVELLRGEAHFDVAKNPARPFIVAADQVAVRAVGTAFDVRLRAEAVEVLVTEGRVQVNDVVLGRSLLPAVPGSDLPPMVTQGERVIVPRTASEAAPAAMPLAVATVAPAEVRRALAWQERRLEFDDQSLADVVAEFNRYNRTTLVLADPALAPRRFSGVFRADGYEPFVRLLEENFRVAATRTGGTIELRVAP